MPSARIDQYRDIVPVNDVQASAYQRKSLLRIVSDRWDKVQLAVEPWLHCVLVGRLYVGQMSGLQRAHMSIEQFGRNASRLHAWLDQEEGNQKACRYG